MHPVPFHTKKFTNLGTEMNKVTDTNLSSEQANLISSINALCDTQMDNHNRRPYTRKRDKVPSHLAEDTTNSDASHSIKKRHHAASTTEEQDTGTTGPIYRYFTASNSTANNAKKRNKHPTDSSQRTKTKTNPEYEEQNSRDEITVYSVDNSSSDFVQEACGSSSMGIELSCIPQANLSYSDVMQHDKRVAFSYILHCHRWRWASPSGYDVLAFKFSLLYLLFSVFSLF